MSVNIFTHTQSQSVSALSVLRAETGPYRILTNHSFLPLNNSGMEQPSGMVD